MTVARFGPISAINAKKITNASAVQTSPSTAIEAMPVAATWPGQWVSPYGAQATADSSSAADTTGNGGRSDSCVAKMIGPVA